MNYRWYWINIIIIIFFFFKMVTAQIQNFLREETQLYACLYVFNSDHCRLSRSLSLKKKKVNYNKFCILWFALAHCKNQILVSTVLIQVIMYHLRVPVLLLMLLVLLRCVTTAPSYRWVHMLQPEQWALWCVDEMTRKTYMYFSIKKYEDQVQSLNSGKAVSLFWNVDHIRHCINPNPTGRKPI